MTNTKTVNLNLVGLDSNAFSLMGAFARQARKEGWTKEEISAVTEECVKGDYNHLLATLMNVCENKDDWEEAALQAFLEHGEDSEKARKMNTQDEHF